MGLKEILSDWLCPEIADIIIDYGTEDAILYTTKIYHSEMDFIHNFFQEIKEIYIPSRKIAINFLVATFEPFSCQDANVFFLENPRNDRPDFKEIEIEISTEIAKRAETLAILHKKQQDIKKELIENEELKTFLT
jgi:hypothetical protein